MCNGKIAITYENQQIIVSGKKGQAYKRITHQVGMWGGCEAQLL